MPSAYFDLFKLEHAFAQQHVAAAMVATTRSNNNTETHQNL